MHHSASAHYNGRMLHRIFRIVVIVGSLALQGASEVLGVERVVSTTGQFSAALAGTRPRRRDHLAVRRLQRRALPADFAGKHVRSTIPPIRPSSTAAATASNSATPRT